MLSVRHFIFCESELCFSSCSLNCYVVHCLIVSDRLYARHQWSHNELLHYVVGFRLRLFLQILLLNKWSFIPRLVFYCFSEVFLSHTYCCMPCAISPFPFFYFIPLVFVIGSFIHSRKVTFKANNPLSICKKLY